MTERTVEYIFVYVVLQKNLSLNFPQTTTAVHCGIWSEPGSKKAFRQSLQANSFLPDTLTGGYHGVDVPTESVDSLLESLGIEMVDLLIMTINGAEVEAFKGMTQSLPRIGAMAIAARYGEPGEDRVETVCGWLTQHGYETSVVGKDHVYGRRLSTQTIARLSHSRRGRTYSSCRTLLHGVHRRDWISYSPLRLHPISSQPLHHIANRARSTHLIDSVESFSFTTSKRSQLWSGSLVTVVWAIICVFEITLVVFRDTGTICQVKSPGRRQTLRPHIHTHIDR